MGNLVFTQGLPIFDAIYDAFFHTTFPTSNGLYTTFPTSKIVVNFRQATTYCGRFPQKSVSPLKFRYLNNRQRKTPETVRVMFVGTQVDTMSCKGADSVCCPLSCVFSSVFIMREAGIPHSGAAQCAAAPRPAPFRCPPCRCRGRRCGCSGGSCGSISPSVLPPRSAG